MELKETQITSSWLGAVKKALCPVCAAPVTMALGGNPDILCRNCGEYLAAFGDKLRQLDPGRVAPLPTFAAATPWTDIAAARSPNIHFDVESYLHHAVMTKQEGVRVLDAKWPEGCCICGKPAVRRDNYGETIEFTPPGIIRVRDKEAKLIAQGIPYCGEHKDGVRFAGVLFSNPSELSEFGLLFRSLAYRNKFRQLNGWRWPSEKFTPGA